MTTMINLLPWREERRKQRQHEFIAMLAFAALLAGLIFWLWKGMVEGQIADQAKAHNMTEEQVVRDVLLASQPNKKFVETSELGALAVFLSSEAGASITGIALPVDGGWTAH